MLKLVDVTGEVIDEFIDEGDLHAGHYRVVDNDGSVRSMEFVVEQNPGGIQIGDISFKEFVGDNTTELLGEIYVNELYIGRREWTEAKLISFIDCMKAGVRVRIWTDRGHFSVTHTVSKYVGECNFLSDGPAGRNTTSDV